ncbi:MAG: tetratricopeptide repeat protein [Gammaproteobacteria bacterium]|nr:tetratricopeptide repeat protein [Gammaproteobacteria bacterium]
MKNILLIWGIAGMGLLAPVTGITAAEGPSTEQEMEQYVQRGQDLVLQHKPAEAISKYLDKAYGWCETTHAKPGVKLYAARDGKETLAYLMMAAAGDKNSGENTKAVVIPFACAYALYLKGYALLELRDMAGAEAHIKRVVDMSPMNAQFLSELGHIHQLKKDWQQTLAIFTKAESAARDFSPDNTRPHDLGRAKRGIGFTLIELGQLDKAEAKFRECLKINPNDKSAQSELLYIEQLRSKGK